MFGKLPQRISAPFGLLGDDAKLAFPSQPGGVSKLATVRNIPENDSYWNQYFVLFDSASDVFSLIMPHHIRRALQEAPENVATLVRVVTARLFNLISDHTFPSTSGSVTSFASSIMKGGSVDRNTTKEVLNCLRILQRVLPVIFEVEGESNAFETELLWKEQEVEEVGEEVEVVGEIAQSQFVIDDDEESDTEEGKSHVQPTTPKPKILKKTPSLGQRLFNSIIDLMFCCGFTLPSKIQVDHYKINYVIWEKGIGSTSDPGPSSPYDSNKTEVLRLLLVLLSRQIYIPPHSLLSNPSLYSLHLVQKASRRDVLTVLCSLLNTAMNSPTYNDTSISGMAGKLPYNHLVFKGEDPRANLVGMCLQVLCVLLDFQSGSAKDITSGREENQTLAPTPKTNAFRYFLMKLHRSQDFDFILGGILGIMEQQMAATNNLLPGAKKSLPYVTKTIIFFWKTIELNKKFKSYLLESERFMDLVVHLLCYCVDIKDKPQQHGLCRAISYIIQTLSAEPAFGMKLADPVKVQLPSRWNTATSVADFLIHTIYAMVATTSGTLNFLYPALIIALSNVAPYFRGLSVTSSTRLIQLFTSFSNPLFLLSDEGHPRLLFFMLEVFNSVIFNRLAENPNLLYGIISSHKVFEDLGTFTLTKGLRDIKRAQALKEELAKKDSNNNTPKNRSSENDDIPSSQAEKSRLLEERQDSTLAVEESDNVAGGSPRAFEEPNRQSTDQDTPILRSPISPTTEAFVLGSPSEKARGKMRDRRSLSIDANQSLERIALSGIGRNGFVPTQEWVSSWQQGLPLDAIMLLISELLPKVQELQTSRKANSPSAIIDFLSTVTLTHILPPSPPITFRKFIWSDASIVWLTSLIWGEIYVKGMSPLGVWNATNVRLFYVKHIQAQRQISETVSNVVGGFLRRNSDSPQARRA